MWCQRRILLEVLSDTQFPSSCERDRHGTLGPRLTNRTKQRPENRVIVRPTALQEILKRRAIAVLFSPSCYAGTNSCVYLLREVLVSLSVSTYSGTKIIWIGYFGDIWWSIEDCCKPHRCWCKSWGRVLGEFCWHIVYPFQTCNSRLLFYFLWSISFFFFFCFAEWKNVRYPGASKDKDSSFHYPLRFFFLVRAYIFPFPSQWWSSLRTWKLSFLPNFWCGFCRHYCSLPFKRVTPIL